MTNNNLNNSIDIYLQEIYKKLHISDKEKKAFLRYLKSDIYQFREDNPNITMADIYERFGTPDEVAENYYESIDTEDIQKKLSNKRLNRSAILLAVFLIAVIAVIWILLAVTYEEAELIDTTTDYYYNNYQDFNDTLNN